MAKTVVLEKSDYDKLVNRKNDLEKEVAYLRDKVKDQPDEEAEAEVEDQPDEGSTENEV